MQSNTQFNLKLESVLLNLYLHFFLFFCDALKQLDTLYLLITFTKIVCNPILKLFLNPGVRCAPPVLLIATFNIRTNQYNSFKITH